MGRGHTESTEAESDEDGRDELVKEGQKGRHVGAVPAWASATGNALRSAGGPIVVSDAVALRIMQPTLQGAAVTLRPPTEADVAPLAAIRSTPAVYERWRGGTDMVAAVTDDLKDDETQSFVIEHGGRVVGAIQWGAESDPDYRHASIDIYLDPSVHGRGLGTDAVRTLARHLIVDHGHHRLVIDPAADNLAAIRSYSKVGFRPVGVMRCYERGPDGTWHDGLLMDLLADELIEEKAE